MRQYDKLASKDVKIVASQSGDGFDLMSDGELVATNQYPHKLSRMAFDMGAKTVAHDYDMSIMAYNKFDMT